MGMGTSKRAGGSTGLPGVRAGGDKTAPAALERETGAPRNGKAPATKPKRRYKLAEAVHERRRKADAEAAARSGAPVPQKGRPDPVSEPPPPDGSIYGQLQRAFEEVMCGIGIVPGAASAAAEACMFRLHKLHGGGQLYLPAEYDADKKARNEAIKADFTGRNVGEIADKYGLSRASIYRILAKP